MAQTKFQTEVQVHHLERGEDVPTPKEHSVIHLSGAMIGLSPEDAVKHKRINRSFDFTLLPLLAIMNFLSSLDKGNLSNAQTVGFSKDIGVTPLVINNSVTLYYVTYLTLQPVNAFIALKVGPRYWLGTLMAGWGVFVIANAFVHTYGQVIALRIMIGLCESGFSPICIYYLSTFYSRFDLGWRIGLFFALSAIPGGFSGAIAYGILKVRGALHAWQYLFIIEGAITIFFALLCTLALPSKPSTAWMISKADREYIVRREQLDEPLNKPVKSTRRDFIELARDWKLWLILPFSIAGAVPIATFPVFLPLVLRGFGYSGNTANLMSVPPNICGVVGLLITTWSSDRMHDRGIHIISTLGVTLIGSILVVTITHNVARYICLCIMLLGAFAVTPLTSAWLAGNTPVPSKRVLVIGCAGWGYVSGILGSQIFKPKYAPRYLTPFYVVLGLNIFAIVGYSGYQMLLRRVNRSRALKVARMTPAEIQAEGDGNERLGDKKYTFQYQI